MTILSKLSKGIAVTAVATGISLSPIASSNISHAATEATSTTQNNSAAGQMSKVGEHDAQFNLNKNITYDVDENGVATLTDKNSGKTEQLPYSSKDKDGKDVTLVYYEENDKLFVHAQEKSSERGWKKCAAGIAGGATTGATTVGLAGASVGTVTLPLVGTVGGGVVGAVGGGVGGGLTGGATFCGK